ncbi:hypothetical protein [Halanaerobacter jeridensis]|uniref:Uncharacterized protein n=1 Tax=Halanaerobacter jeridensis TaxID=706427 RepID=A0A939BMY9_9FIRM|nr:hypothetical protein [Halanaerobacter jeridensis]MBM7557795.1 hypothetical protein [Halanaerobacter jeridensis]
MVNKQDFREIDGFDFDCLYKRQIDNNRFLSYLKNQLDSKIKRLNTEFNKIRLFEDSYFIFNLITDNRLNIINKSYNRVILDFVLELVLGEKKFELFSKNNLGLEVGENQLDFFLDSNKKKKLNQALEDKSEINCFIKFKQIDRKINNTEEKIKKELKNEGQINEAQEYKLELKDDIKTKLLDYLYTGNPSIEQKLTQQFSNFKFRFNCEQNSFEVKNTNDRQFTLTSKLVLIGEKNYLLNIAEVKTNSENNIFSPIFIKEQRDNLKDELKNEETDLSFEIRLSNIMIADNNYKFILPFDYDKKMRLDYLAFLQEHFDADESWAAKVESISDSPRNITNSIKYRIDLAKKEIKITTNDNKDFKLDYDIVIANKNDTQEELVLFSGKKESDCGLIVQQWDYNDISQDKKDLARRIKNKLEQDCDQFKIYIKVYELKSL